MKVTCSYDRSVAHEYPDDWQFGGADNTHPGADPRYMPQTYLYFDRELNVVWRTTMMTCDEQARAFITTAEQTHKCAIIALQKLVPGEKNATVWSDAAGVMAWK